jgi:hypothetical protein
MTRLFNRERRYCYRNANAGNMLMFPAFAGTSDGDGTVTSARSYRMP